VRPRDDGATRASNALAVFQKLNAEQPDYLDALTEFVDAHDKPKPVRWHCAFSAPRIGKLVRLFSGQL
jgi:hypothetical protein